jgi:hypothetical protein
MRSGYVRSDTAKWWTCYDVAAARRFAAFVADAVRSARAVELNEADAARAIAEPGAIA